MIINREDYISEVERQPSNPTRLTTSKTECEVGAIILV